MRTADLKKVSHSEHRAYGSLYAVPYGAPNKLVFSRISC